MTNSVRHAVVTGANRGLGLEVVRQLADRGYHVFLTARNESSGQQALQELLREKSDRRLDFLPLDIAHAASVERFRAALSAKVRELHVLVNNAGILIDDREAGDRNHVLSALPEEILQTFETNTLGPYRVTRALLPLIRAAKRQGRVVNVSSTMGQLSEMSGGYEAYRISKTALNAFTKVLAEELKEDGTRVNSVHPGWVKTDMGGPQASRELGAGGKSIVWAATLPDDGPTGGFFYDGQALAW